MERGGAHVIECPVCGLAGFAHPADVYTCPRCRGEERELEKLLELSVERRERERELLERTCAKYHAALAAAIPEPSRAVPDLPAFAKAGPASFRAAMAIAEWLACELSPLWLYGPVGTGKTTAAACAALARSEAGVRVSWTSAQAAMAHKEPPDTRAELIVLDDLSAIRLSAFRLERVSLWVERVYNAGVPVLVTSNLAPGDLIAEMARTLRDEGLTGERVMRRLLEYGRVIEVTRGA